MAITYVMQWPHTHENDYINVPAIDIANKCNAIDVY